MLFQKFHDLLLPIFYFSTSKLIHPFYDPFNSVHNTMAAEVGQVKCDLLKPFLRVQSKERREGMTCDST